jgi:hypothetical protein
MGIIINTPYDYYHYINAKKCGYNHLAFHTAELKRFEDEIKREDTKD